MRTCPIDRKKCDYDIFGDDEWTNPMRSCRYKKYININTENPPCGLDSYRKKKSTKLKSKRKCRCK